VSFRPGRHAIKGLLVSTALAVASFWVPLVALGIAPLLIGLVAGVVIDLRALRQGLGTVSVKPSVRTTIGRGLPFNVVLRICNDSKQRLRAEVRVGVPTVAQPDHWLDKFDIDAAQVEHELAREFCIPNRGRYEFGPVWLRVMGPMGLLEAQHSLQGSEPINVMPESFWSAEKLARDDASERQLLDKVARARQHGAGTEFESLSEFRSGDDPQRVDWRASARTRRLIVRRFQVERHRDVMILVDCGRLMAAGADSGTKLDCAVDAALMLSRVALQSGDRCGLGVFDDQVLGYMPPVTGPNAMRTLVNGLYDLQSRWRESDFSRMFSTLQSRQRKRSLIVVLSDIVNDETTSRFRSSLSTLARRHVVLFAALKTPLLTTLPQLPIESILDASRRTVAFRVLRERERAVHSLQRSAVHVLDVEASQLSAPLINQYIELRRHNIL
jgi:uncharacterized protein (DUF58 family)